MNKTASDSVSRPEKQNSGSERKKQRILPDRKNPLFVLCQFTVCFQNDSGFQAIPLIQPHCFLPHFYWRTEV